MNVMFDLVGNSIISVLLYAYYIKIDYFKDPCYTQGNIFAAIKYHNNRLYLTEKL